MGDINTSNNLDSSFVFVNADLASSGNFSKSQASQLYQEPSLSSKIIDVAKPVLDYAPYLQYAKYVPGLPSVVDCDKLAQAGKICSNVKEIGDGIKEVKDGSPANQAWGALKTAVKVAEFAAPFLPHAAGVAVVAIRPIMSVISAVMWAGNKAVETYSGYGNLFSSLRHTGIVY